MIAIHDAELGLRYLTTDHLGTPILASDGLGSVAWSGGFEPFGADFSGAAGSGVFLRFPGQWADGSWGASAVEDPVAYNVYRWYSADQSLYLRPDPAGLLRSGLRLLGFVDSRPTVATDPVGLTTCVMISGISTAGIGNMELAFFDHASMFFVGDCKKSGGSSSGQSCSPPRPFLYDPNGGYPQQRGFEDSGQSFILDGAIPGWDLTDYFDYQCGAGSDFLEFYCFPTTCCEEAEIENQVGVGGSGFLGCSLNTARGIAGIGPFQDVGTGLSPALLRRAMNRILRRNHQQGGTTRTLRCPPK